VKNWRAIMATAAILAGVVSAHAGSESVPAKEPALIAHGRQISQAVVGPRAAGYGQLERHVGAVIKSGVVYPFAKVVSGPAVYDGFRVGGPHLLIEGAEFTGALDIYSVEPVVLRGVRFQLTEDSHWAVHTRPGAGGFYLLWSEIESTHRVGTALLLRGDNAVVHRSIIRDASDAIHADAAGAAITENLIDSLSTYPGDHNDAIQIAPQATHIEIGRNRIENPNPQTSCIYVQGNNITIRDNLLAGGGWVIYGGANGNGHGGPGSRGVTVSGNIFGQDHWPKSGHFGPIAYWGPGPDGSNAWRDNRLANGADVKP
jgi:hypothetical protein